MTKNDHTPVETTDDLGDLVSDLESYLDRMQIITDVFAEAEPTAETLSGLLTEYRGEIGQASHVLLHLKEALQAHGLLKRIENGDDTPF